MTTRRLGTQGHPFTTRHLGPSAEDDRRRMLEAIGFDSVDELVDATVPDTIRQTDPLDLPAAMDEAAVRARLVELAGRNRPLRSMIGQGYHPTVTPAVIRRNLLEDPGWYTAYTPYQPEISQGRLEALLNFQTAVADLTGLPLANASLLDEPTAAAEAMAMARRLSRVASDVFLVDADVHPQTKHVLETRAAPLGIKLVPVDPAALPDEEAFGVLLQYPGTSGEVRDLRDPIQRIHDRGGLAVVAADPLALTLLTPPGELGADIAVGSTQRFGIPMWYGGPHAAYLATHDANRRALPGRLVGVSGDAAGRPARRLALQTREPHRRRARAPDRPLEPRIAALQRRSCVPHRPLPEAPAAHSAVASRAPAGPALPPRCAIG